MELPILSEDSGLCPNSASQSIVSHDHIIKCVP